MERLVLICEVQMGAILIQHELWKVLLRSHMKPNMMTEKAGKSLFSAWYNRYRFSSSLYNISRC